MIIKDLLDEDFINYKKPSMFIIFPKCTFKCGDCCQNLPVAAQKDIEVDPNKIVQRYISNPITKALVFGGLEPFDTFDEMENLVSELRKETSDDIVIYTGYNEDEILPKVEALSKYPNIIIKFGRYKPNDKEKYDEILGVTLASQIQYARRIS